MLGMARQELVERYAFALQDAAKVSKELAENWANKASIEEMEIYLNWYDKLEKQ